MDDEKEKKSSNNKKDISHKTNNNKRDLAKKYPIIGITILMVASGIIIGYSYFGKTNPNSVSSPERSNLLGDWSDIHDVAMFNTAAGGGNDVTDADHNNYYLYLATNNGLYSKNQNSSWFHVGSDKSDITGL